MESSTLMKRVEAMLKPHVRSGHYKNQAVGPGRQDRKRIWINAYLVNYGPGTTIDAPPQYLVVP